MPSRQSAYRFGNVQLLSSERRLILEGRDAPIGARAFDLLLALIERRGRVVTRDELLDVVWPDAMVEPNNLAVQVGALRKVLGPQVVATVPGRGYRFIAVVDEPALAPVQGLPDDGGRSNLPEVLLPLIGRDDERREVGRLIEDHRIVTIVGAGGIGKTRLAQQVLHGCRGAWPHGVCWVELASVVDSSSLVSAVSAALGIPLLEGSSRPALEAALAPLEIVIGLDNAEHLLSDVAALVEALLFAAPRLKVLVTSQAPLRLREESVFRLGALSVPPAGVPPDEALCHGAVALFVQRSQAIDARFRLDDANTRTIVRLCDRLDGMPLAIEFAAARAPVLGVDWILESLDERLQLLKGGYSSAPARQQTMRATLDWSHRLLGVGEQKVFRRLAVVAGSASLEFIQAIVADPDDPADEERETLDPWTVVDLLGTLIDRSLVTMVRNPSDADRPRYRLLETLRAYARERLVEADEVALLEERHARAVAASMRRAWVERWDGRIALRVWIDLVEADRDNARQAVAWALEHLALEVVMPIAAVLLTRYLPGAAHGEQAALADVLDRWLPTQAMEPEQLPVRTQLMVFRKDRDVQRSLREVEGVLSLAQSCDDRFAMYLIESQRLRLHVQTRDLGAAAAALARVESLEDAGWPAIRLWVGAEARGTYWYVAGPPAVLLEAVLREYQLAKLAGATGYAGLSHLINAQIAVGEFAAAVAQATALLEELNGSRDAFGLLVTHFNLVSALLELGDLAGGKQMAQAAWRLAGSFALQAECADYLALIAALEERWSQAAALIGYADAIYHRRGTQRWPNELRVHQRAASLARTALDTADLVRRMDDGAKLADVEIEAIAFSPA